MTHTSRVGLGLAAVALFTGVTLANPGTTETTDELAARLEVLQEDYADARNAFFEKLTAAPADKQGDIYLNENPWLEYCEQFEALARDASGTETGAEAWAAVFNNGLGGKLADRSWAAFEILTNDYVDSPAVQQALAGASRMGAGRDGVQEAMMRVAERSALAENRAAAHFNLGAMLMSDEETREKAREQFLLLTMDYRDVEGPRGKTYGEIAEINLFDLENLQVGCEAPDITAMDETGTEFTLGEYEGKVVLVDFWGFW